MRIAIIGSRGFPSTYGGFETLVRHLAPHLKMAGHDITVYCRNGTALTWRSNYHGGIRQVLTPGIDRKLASTLSFGLSSSVDAMFRRYDVAIVLNVANGFYLPFLERAGIRTLVNVDGVEWERNKWNKVGKRAFEVGAALTAKYASEIITDSVAIGDVWERLYGRRGKFVPYGGDLVSDRKADRILSLGISPGSYYLVVARLSPENNVKLILDAHQCIPAKWPLVVVGSANYDHELVRRLKSKVDRDVLWLGHVSNQELLVDLWFFSGLYIHGHSVGGTNPALLQALGAGAPSIAYDSPFNYEVLRSEEQLFQPNLESLVRAMSSARENQDLREAFRANGIARVRAAYQWPEVCAEYEALCLGASG